MKAGSLALLAFFFWVGAVRADPAADEAVWKRIAQGGVAVMIRHARTEPGVGDPPNFRIGDCTTQRNLSAEGRVQARRLGAAASGQQQHACTDHGSAASGEGDEGEVARRHDR